MVIFEPRKADGTPNPIPGEPKARLTDEGAAVTVAALAEGAWARLIYAAKPF